MNPHNWLSILPQLLILLPSAASCYLPAKNHMNHSPGKTAALCLAVLIPYSFLAAVLHSLLQLNINTILAPSLVVFFFLYRRTVRMDMSKALAVYMGVCAVQTFPTQFAFALDAQLHPMSGASCISPEAALFQLGLACMMPLLAFPARHHYAWAIEHLDFPKIWYSTVGLSVLFLLFNLLCVPRSYQTLHAGRMSYLFPLFEGCALVVLITVYMLFYRCARLILEHVRLREHAQLLEIQAHQYRTLQEHMQQTARLRHDFRHHIRLLSSLSEQGDFASLQTYLLEYSHTLDQNQSRHFCANAALNALFGYYYEIAALAGIDTNWKITLPEPLIFHELDLAALFGNLMENAISGCQTLPREERYFSLTSEIRYGSSLYVVATNSFNGIVRKGKSGYRSTKHNGKGTGLSSILAVAEKYQGTAQFSNSPKEFYSDVMLKGEYRL